MVTSDDIYNGYFIRAGTIIIGNTWYVCLSLIRQGPTRPPPRRAGPCYTTKSPIPSHSLSTRNDSWTRTGKATPLRTLRRRPLATAGGKISLFKHRRFLTRTVQRICPGRWLSDAQLWISIASMLAVFNIGPGLDEHGQIAKAEAAFVFGMISFVPSAEDLLIVDGCFPSYRHPRPFRCSIKPRDDAAASLIISE
jgi:hypothetical protein